MNTLRITVAAFLVALTAFGALAGSNDDLKAMQGSWAASIVEIDGRPATKEEMNLKLVLVVQGDAYRVMLNDQALSAGTLKLDAGKTPRTIDCTHSSGQFKGAVQKGIYEIKADKMVAVFAKPGNDRPADFKTKEGSEQSIVQYVRLKK